MRDRINEEYFKWLVDSVCENRYSRHVSFEKLLLHLHDVEFVYSIPRDQNRALDGIDLRYRFALEADQDDIDLYLDGPCSVLEMMVALAIRCEENLMDDPNVGNRTGQWFWGMVVNLGLGAMTNTRYDEQYVDHVIDKFLNREYEPDGEGGLFTVRGCDIDLRTAEIWRQLCRYIDYLENI